MNFTLKNNIREILRKTNFNYLYIFLFAFSLKKNLLTLQRKNTMISQRDSKKALIIIDLSSPKPCLVFTKIYCSKKKFQTFIT